METKYQTKEINSTHANSTVVIRRAGDTKVPGELGIINILKDSAHAVTFYDGEDATGDQILIKAATSVAGCYQIKRPLRKGLCAVVAASFAGTILVSYN